jgi:hypothetical protein
MTSGLAVPYDSPQGDQRARISSFPPYASTSGDETIALARLAGIELDEWQQTELRHEMGESPDWKCPRCTHRAAEPIPCPRHPGEQLLHPWAAFECCEIVSRQNGKDMDCRTPILTTAGWKTMGTVEAGDHVYGPDGKPTKVLATSEIFTDHCCYEVEFHDGSTFIAGEDHLWRVWDKGAYDAEIWRATGDRNASNGTWRTLSTSAIAASRWGFRRASKGRMEYRYRVRCDAIPQTPEVDLPIDPYIFGYWLGDGSSDASALTVGAEDHDHVVDEIARAGYRVVSEAANSTGAWNIHFNMYGCGPGRPDGISRRLRSLGVLGNKHIPECYLSASPSQRRALLAGLLDSDGTIGGQAKTPRVEYCSTRERLGLDVFRLARSLGARTRPLTAPAVYQGREVGTRWRIAWTPTVNPFRIARKAARWRAPVSDRQKWMSIVGIRPVETVPTRCIRVAHPEHVFLVGATFIPTHNSEKRVVRMLGGLYIVEEQLQIYSAHLFDTAMEIFRRLAFLVENCDDLRAEVKQRGGKLVGITRSHGQEGIELRDGRRIRFKARTGGGGRGFSADCLYLDEAMILPEVFLGATVPTLSARPNPQICLSGSAPDEEDPAHDGVVLAKRRARALAGGDPSLAYFEHSAKVGEDPSKDDPATVPASILDDPATWAEANPGLSRIGLEYIANERRAMSDRQFAVERLSVGKYPDITSITGRVIAAAAWAELADPQSRIASAHCFAFDVDPGQKWATLSAAGVRSDGLYHVGVVEHATGIGWLVKSSKAWLERYPEARLVVDPRIDLANLLKELSEAGIQIVPDFGASEYKDACGGFLQLVVDKRLRYMPPQPELDAAIAGATTKPLLDAWKWSRKSGALITPLVSCTLALWGARTQGAPQVWDLDEIIRAKEAAKSADFDADSDAEPEQQAPDRSADPPGFIRLEDLPVGFRG